MLESGETKISGVSSLPYTEGDRSQADINTTRATAQLGDTTRLTGQLEGIMSLATQTENTTRLTVQTGVVTRISGLMAEDGIVLEGTALKRTEKWEAPQ